MKLKEQKVGVVAVEPEATAEVPVENRLLTVDVERAFNYRRVITNVKVRALDVSKGRKVDCDIAHLDRRSLLLWLSSDPELAKNTLLTILGHAVRE